MSIQLQGQVNLDFTQADAQLENFRRKLSSKDFSQPLGRISGDAAEFRKSLEAATARVTAFGLTAGAIYKVSEAIRAGARATIEVDKQLVELNTFLGQSKNQLEDFSRSLFKVARNAAVPFEAATEAAKEFARQGLSTNEVLKRTEDALTLARISGINYGDAVNGITTAINSFNKEALSSTDIINKLIAVDTRFAVSSAQLNEALTRVGSSAEESGISIDKLIATVTAAQQITGRGGAVIGNALKTIFTRLQRPEVITQLQQLGVSVKDQNGFLLDGISILKNYADATKNLSQIEKSRTAELIGGIYQINQVNALIKDLSSSNSVTLMP
jgi:TP901 family phage tail tape measure protein